MASSFAESEPSAASRLLAAHTQNAHHVEVEDVPDEDLPAPVASNANAAEPPKSSAESSAAPKVPAPKTARYEEQFPELGSGTKSAPVAPVWAARAGAANGTPPSSGPSSGINTPNAAAAAAAAAAPRGPRTLTIPGRNVEYMLLDPHHVLPRNQLKRPLVDIVKDFNRRSRAQIKVTTQADGKVRVEATGPQEIATQALKDFIAIIGTKQKINVQIPRIARAHIIGKGGSVIKALQEQTGARIQMPKLPEGEQLPDDEDDDALIDVTIEGNAQQAAAARNAVLKIAGERAGNVNTRVKGIPAVFYPFLASHKETLEKDSGVQIRVPTYHPWSAQPPVVPAPGQRPEFPPAVEELIQLAGEREAVRLAREAIEQRARELHQQLMMEQLSIQRGRHQFIIGERGVPVHKFFEETGCAIILPTDEEDDVVTIVGPADRVHHGVEKAMDLAMNMQCANLDISRFYRQAPGGAAVHARNVTRYLRQRKEIERLEKLYSVHFNTPFSEDGALPWELYSRDGKNALRAQSEIKGLVDAHPPARMATIVVDPFFHHYIRQELSPQVRQNWGVHVVIPDASEASAPVLLVYEGTTNPAEYQLPRVPPTQSEIEAMKKALQEAQNHVLGLINQQESLASRSIEVPEKYHDKLRKFIKKEQDKKPADQMRVRVSNVKSTVNLRGPASAVESLTQKCLEFIEQEKQEEKERGFTLEFDFPQKFANHLIGKGGSHIRELREKFDVEIQVDDGKVILKGPKAKAEAARKHITDFARQLENEVTYVLKIEPKFHGELIGKDGKQIHKLSTRYNVLINFPKTTKGKEEEASGSASDAGKPRRQQAADEVVIRGPKKGADEARDELLSLLQYLKDTSYSATVTVQQKQVPSLIGAGGEALNKLREMTGARIDVPKDAVDGKVEISIKGTKAQVEAAKKILLEKKAIFDDTVVKTIEVDRKHHRALIGAGGSALRDLVVNAGGSAEPAELARTIQFPKQDSDGNTIKIEGRTAVVEKIIAQIQAIVAEREAQITETIDVPVEKHRTLIGRGGEAKRNLEMQFSVSIDVPRQGSGKTGVKIVGRPENVEKAKAHIQELVKEQPGETILVPKALHHAVSNNGQIFRRLRNDFHVTVDHAGHAIPPKPAAPANTRAPTNGSAGLPLITDEAVQPDVHSWVVITRDASADSETIPWVLRGSSAEDVEKAKKAVQSALDQARAHDTTGYLVLPDPRTYRHVIGHGGSKINSIRKKSGCNVTVPREHADGDAIVIVGSKEGVEKAKDMILNAVREGESGRRNE